MTAETASILMESEIALPDYLNPDKRSKVGRRNDLDYEIKRLALQRDIMKMDLPTAIKYLHAQQMDAGQIADDLSLVRYFQGSGPGDAYFIGQYNQTRAKRMSGAGRQNPPPGVETKKTPSPDCYLCTDNVRWQQRGVQLYYQIELNGNRYNVLCNPFPFMPIHVTVAAADHEPQSWHRNVNWKNDNKVERMAADLYELARQLPEFVCFYNGVGAGASIEKHFHYQAFRPSFSHGVFPLQKVAANIAARRKTKMGIAAKVNVIEVDDGDYPTIAFRLTGERDEVTKAIVEWVNRWSDLIGEDASANIATIWEDNTLALYLVPRNKSFSRSIGMTGTVGGLEVLGEFIFCTEEENKQINAGEIGYQRMYDILRGIRPPKIDRLTNSYGR
jgi:hypothetical protein